jgi:hypothetical protein
MIELRPARNSSKLALDKGGGRRHGSAQRMQLTGTIYFGMCRVWSVWMARRVSRPTWQTVIKSNHPGQQEEST